MIYRVRHRTRFAYTAPVRHTRCNLRLHPIDTDGQAVRAYRLETVPPAELRPGPDSGYRAIVERMTLDRPAREIAIEARAEVAVTRVAPAPLPGDPTVAKAARAAALAAELGPMAPANYLYPSPLIAPFPEIAAWCAAELAPARGMVDAGLALAQAIRRDFRYDGSATELDTSPAEAFAARQGVCQDFAQIMISGARAAGLAAAYVSGYLRTNPPPGQARLVGADATHAWVLLWCGPSRGWLGFDPTNGVTVGPDHIVCAIGRDYGDVSPIDGIFVGRDGQEIEVEVDVEPMDEED